MNFNISKIVAEWAYRVKDGCPDSKKSSDVAHLENILFEQGLKRSWINKYILSLSEGKGDTSATTFYHEIISGIAAVKNVSDSDFKTGEDVKKFFDNGTIKPVNASLSPFSIMSMKQARFLTKDSIPKPALVKDAIASGKAIKSKLKYSKAYWAGPTNDASDFGAADIILSKGSAKNGVGVSLKYGPGQLKNLSGNQFFQAIICGNISNFIHHIHGLNSDGFDKMTKAYVSLMEGEIKASGDKEAIKAFNSMKGAISTWDGYQKRKIDKQTAAIFEKSIGIPAKKMTNVKYLGRKLADRFKKEWQPIKTQFFQIFFGEFIKTHLKTIPNNLGNLLKRQLSVTTNDLWYSSPGGTNLKMIPGSKRFDELVKNLDLSNSHKSSGSGYNFTIHVKHTASGKELGTITVIIRWKQGQMSGYPDTTSSAKWNIDNKEWGEIFN